MLICIPPSELLPNLLSLNTMFVICHTLCGTCTRRNTTQQWKGTSTCKELSEPPMRHAKWQKPGRQGCMLYHSITWHSRKGTSLRTEGRWVIAKGWDAGVIEQQEENMEGDQGVVTCLYVWIYKNSWNCKPESEFYCVKKKKKWKTKKKAQNTELKPCSTTLV